MPAHVVPILTIGLVCIACAGRLPSQPWTPERTISQRQQQVALRKMETSFRNRSADHPILRLRSRFRCSASTICLPPRTTLFSPARPFPQELSRVRLPEPRHEEIIIVRFDPVICVRDIAVVGGSSYQRRHSGFCLKQTTFPFPSSSRQSVSPSPSRPVPVRARPALCASYCDEAGAAYFWVHSRAVAMAAFSSSFQALATSAASGSSGLGAPRSAWMERRMVRIWRAGDQLSVQARRAWLAGASLSLLVFLFSAVSPPTGLSLHNFIGILCVYMGRKGGAKRGADANVLFRTSRQMRPSLSTLGWKILVRKRILGGTMG